MELEALGKVAGALHSLGAGLVALSPQLNQFLKLTSKKLKLTFPLLGDIGNRVASQFGIVFRLPDDLIEIYTGFGAVLPRFNRDDSWTLPMPGRFVINRRGIIHSRDVHPDYTVRPEPDELIALIKSCD